MFYEIVPDLLRGSTTTICIILLLPILSKSKISIKFHIFLTLIITIIDLAICIKFYMIGYYTGVVYYSLLFYLLIIIGLKFLLKDDFFQWLFNSVTVLNIYAMIVISSYFLSHLFAYPEYANTVIRIVFFAITIITFRKILRPLYLEVSENWAAFVLPTLGILANYLYILLSLGDVEVSMNENINHFYFLTFITILSYIAIIYYLKSLRVKFLLREENIKRQSYEELLKNEIVSYESSVNAAKQTRHDIRHHNSILAEYLSANDIEGAKNYIKLYDENIRDNALKDFSKNPIANAVFRIYDRRSRENNVEFVVQSQADTMLINRLPEIGVVLSNIFENALTACKQYSLKNKHIYYSSVIQNGSILIEIKNSVEGKRVFENGIPVTTKSGGGTGLLSVKSIVEKHKGMLEFKQENNEFYTHIILPIIK